MFKNIFLSTEGSDTIATLGFLEGTRKEFRDISHITVQGTACIIAFFKCLGYTYRKMFDILRNFPPLLSMVPMSNLMFGNEEQNCQAIKEYLIKFMEASAILNENHTLEDVEKLTGYKFAFVVWDKQECEFLILDGRNTPKYKLIDCIMAGLCCMGVYSMYEIENKIFGCSTCIDPYHFEIVQRMNLKTLYVYNFTRFGVEKDGPLGRIEDEMILINIEKSLMKYKLLKGKEDIIVIYTRNLSRISLDAELQNLFSLGETHALYYLEKKDTKDIPVY